MIVQLKNLKGTKKFAEKIARSDKRIFALVGDLGSGKTTLTQFLLQALGVTEKITSPTFLIIKNYELGIKNQGNYRRAYHVDCYRLHNEQEILTLDFKKVISDPTAIVIIEWADKIKSLLPVDQTQWLYFKHGVSEHERIVETNNI